jgi:SAM-dependent methyltransferase
MATGGFDKRDGAPVDCLRAAKYSMAMSIQSRLKFWLAYVFGETPWDTGETPPELKKTIEGAEALPPGRALDLGCGTGTNALYLARHGWEAVGVDFVDRAIQEARQKAQKAGAGVRFFQGDVTRLHQIEGLAGPFDLALDIGCLHSLTTEERQRYAAGLVPWLRPSATYLLYAWGPDPGEDDGRGVSREQVATLYAPQLQIRCVQQGEERGRPSAWYWLEFSPEK